MRSIPLPFNPFLLLFLPIAFGLGLFGDSLGFRIVSLAVIGVAIYGIVMVPMRWAMFFIFLYIGFEGFFKIISNYHPVIHVGSDIVVISLCVKALLSTFMSGKGIGKVPPLTGLFVFHFCWLVVVMFNPYGLGWVPTLGGAKIYITMFTLYFFGYYLTESAKDGRFFMIPFLLVAIVNIFFGLYQGAIGPSSVLSIHPLYGALLAKYEGFAFRPFGLTHQPGGPAVFIFLTFTFLLYYLFYLKSWLMKVMMMALIPLEFMLLLLCQVRSAILKALIGGTLFTLGTIQMVNRISPQRAKGLIAVSAFVGFVCVYFLPSMMDFSVGMQEDNQRAIDKSLSLFDADSAYNAREGGWARFVMYAQEVPFGAGFARVGAAAGAFGKANAADPYFGRGYFFADNLFVAALVEIGLPGVIILSLILMGILWRGYWGYRELKNYELEMVYLAIFSVLIAQILGFFAAEGAIYNPGACFFWFFSGVLMKLPELSKKMPKASLENQFID